VRFAGDFDAPGLGAVGDGDGDREDTVLIGGVDLVGVEAVAEEQLAREGALSAFAGDDLVAFDGLPVPFRADRHRVALDGDVDRGGVDAGQVEVDDEAVAVPVGVHRNARLTGLAPGLVEDTIELAQGIETHEHGHGHLHVYDAPLEGRPPPSCYAHNGGHYVDCQGQSRDDGAMAGEAAGWESAAAVAMAGFLDSCRSSNTRAAYRADLDHLAAWCREGGTIDLLTIDVADIAVYRTACELAGASPATVARRLSAFSSFSAFMAATGTETALTMETGIARPAVEPGSTANILDDADAAALLAAADHVGQRSAVLIRLLMLDGLKVGEVIRADASDVNGRPPRATLLLHDRHPRAIELQTETAAAIRRYLGRRRKGPLVLSEQRGREPSRLSRFGLDYLVKQVARAAGMDQPVSGNTLRRRYVIAAHAKGADLDTIRRHAGHADARTTRRYLSATAR
jgi:integrase/recombinase XerD